MPTRTSNDRVLAVLRTGEAITNLKEFFELLDNSIFFTPFIDRSGFPSPVPFQGQDAAQCLPLFTHESILESALELDYGMWIDEVSLREAIRWTATHGWSKIIINMRDCSFTIDEELMTQIKQDSSRVA